MKKHRLSEGMERLRLREPIKICFFQSWDARAIRVHALNEFNGSLRVFFLWICYVWAKIIYKTFTIFSLILVSDLGYNC